ncbi:MAG: potassium transporter TrkG, partial [Bacteroidia bacterium]|nr:potassium transporter TrkG [Bacteroidia bacterium]
ILGGIGFPLLINLKRLLSYYWSKLLFIIGLKGTSHSRYSHLIDTNTKMVLYTTGILVFGGTALFALLEWNGALGFYSPDEKLVQCFFNAVVPRTAGFNSVATSEFSRLTILMLIVLMWIGGASQSTAGGIKVNTLAVAFASLKSLILGREVTELFSREITYNSIRRALVVIFGSVIIILIIFVLILIHEPAIPAIKILFETVSAFSTVGSSLGITSALCTESKFFLVIIMFIGRVGFITVLMSFVAKEENKKYKLPKEDIIIN